MAGAVTHLVYWLFLGCTLVVSWIPAAWADGAAAWISRRLYRLDGPRQRNLRANLRVALGSGATDEAVESAAEDVYVSYSRYMVEFFTMGWPDLWRRHSRVKPVDLSPLEAALENGAGVVLFGIHSGNWDLAASVSSQLFGDFHSVGEEVRPAWLGMLVSQVRRQGGIALHDGDGGGRELLRALRRGKVVGLVADRTVVGKGVEVEVCSRTARIPTGPVSLAIRTGAPLIPTSIVRNGDGDLSVEFWPAVDLSDLDKGPSDVATGVQRMADQLTALILRGYRSWYALQPIWLDDSDQAESGPNVGN
ncbi:MAG: hypothetical protein QF609_08485 [Gammaproteobacteria bacterium]|nr:hypothetical protein [Gammaproteobacteria bacterium]